MNSFYSPFNASTQKYNETNVYFNKKKQQKHQRPIYNAENEHEYLARTKRTTM